MLMNIRARRNVYRRVLPIRRASFGIACRSDEAQPLRPGFFGQAQLRASKKRKGKPDLWRQRNDDLHYVLNWSLLLDVKIILMMLFSKASYPE